MGFWLDSTTGKALDVGQQGHTAFFSNNPEIFDVSPEDAKGGPFSPKNMRKVYSKWIHISVRGAPENNVHILTKIEDRFIRQLAKFLNTKKQEIGLDTNLILHSVDNNETYLLSLSEFLSLKSVKNLKKYGR
jgi:hypothetical protein